MNHLIQEFKKLNTPKRADSIAEMIHAHTNMLKKPNEININENNNFYNILYGIDEIINTKHILKIFWMY